MPKGWDLRGILGVLPPYKEVAVDGLGDRVKEVAEASLADLLKTMPSPPPQVKVYRLEQDHVALRMVQRRPDGFRMLVLCDIEWRKHQNGMQISFSADWRNLSVWMVVRRLHPFRNWFSLQGEWLSTAAALVNFLFHGCFLLLCVIPFCFVFSAITRLTWVLFLLVFYSSLEIIYHMDQKRQPVFDKKLNRWKDDALNQQLLTLEKRFGFLGADVRVSDPPHP